MATGDFEVNIAPDPTGVPISEETRKRQIGCPAGERTNDQATYPACFCRIEKFLISSKTSPHSFHKFCTGDYTICPTWRMNRDRENRRKGLG